MEAGLKLLASDVRLRTLFLKPIKGREGLGELHV